MFPKFKPESEQSLVLNQSAILHYRMQSSDSSNQLDTLLRKAESYSHFILENQKRAQALIQSRFELTSPQSKSSAKAEASSSSKKRKSPAHGDAHDKVEESRESKGSCQPANLVGGTLMPYQIEGLQWLLSLWENGLNGILADEMGLGKTIQIISLIAHLRLNNTAGPYLIAGPLATISNWVNEFKKWLPSCPVLLYHGSKAEREAMRHKFMPVRDAKSLTFPIVITSFELCIADRPFLEQYVWQYIILDEGHRIKNRNCRLVKELKSIKSVSRLLLTGTPIQNSLEELWSLLNFCSPMIFDDLEVFQSWFDFKNIGKDTKVEDILSTEEQDRIVTKMHEILRPFVLRRIKTETLGDKLPPKREVVVYCGMSSLQREYYARVLSGTLRESLVEVGVEGAKKISQINMLMNQRKVCNHPFLFGDLLDASTGESLREAGNGRVLVGASGKFKLLHRMLPRLKKEGSKVLIFSQMTSLMDILEDYLHLQGHAYVRFDGSTKLAERQRCIDAFNAKDGEVFIFLLSTRAGGLGINLTAADTVILFDSDWNPHQDSQAQDRAHRIGQSKRVVTYRLLTSGSVEIDMMKRQISKKKLERLTMQGGDYRKAGRREGQQQVTLTELKALLEDDVKNLDKREKLGYGIGGSTGETRAASSSSSNRRGRRNGTTTSSAAEVIEIEDADADADHASSPLKRGKAASSSGRLSSPAASAVDEDKAGRDHDHHHKGEDWIQRDISDAELDMIMNRDLLFPHSHLSNVNNKCKSVEEDTTKKGLTNTVSCASLSQDKNSFQVKKEKKTKSSGAAAGTGEGSAVAGVVVSGEEKEGEEEQEEEGGADEVVLDYSDFNSATSAASTDNAQQAADAALVAAWEAERDEAQLAALLGLPLEGEMYDIVADSASSRSILSSLK